MERLKKVELEGIKAEFDKKKGPGLWWDSKPPENGNMFYWFSIFVTSKKENVTKEVQKYINIYEKIGNIDASSCDVIERLSGELDEVFAEAQETKRATRSSTIHRMCRDFTSEGTKEKVDKIKNAVELYREPSVLEKNREKEIKERAEGLTKGYKDKAEKLEKEKREMEIKHKAEVTKLEKENQDIKKEMEEGKSGLEKMGEKLKEEEQNIEREIEERLKTERQNIKREMEEKLKTERQNIKKEMEAQIIEELMGKVSKSSQKTSTGQHQSAQAFDAKFDQPEKPNVQTTSDYTSQQQESNAQTANDSNVPPMSRSRSPSLSGLSSSSNGSHPGRLCCIATCINVLYKRFKQPFQI